MNNDKATVETTTLYLALRDPYDVAVALASYMIARDEIMDAFGVEDVNDLPEITLKPFFIRVAGLADLVPAAR